MMDFFFQSEQITYAICIVFCLSGKDRILRGIWRMYQRDDFLDWSHERIDLIRRSFFKDGGQQSGTNWMQLKPKSLRNSIHSLASLRFSLSLNTDIALPLTWLVAPMSIETIKTDWRNSLMRMVQQRNKWKSFTTAAGIQKTLRLSANMICIYWNSYKLLVASKWGGRSIFSRNSSLRDNNTIDEFVV